MLPVSFGNACCGYPSSEGISEEGSSVDSSNTPHQAIRDGEGVQPLHLHEAFAKADGPLECHAYLGGIHARYRKFLKHPGLAGLISDCETNGCTAVRISGSALKVGETNADYDVKTTIPCGGKPHVRGEIRVVTSQFTNCRYKAQDHLPIDVTFYRKESLAHSRIFKFEIYLYVECSSLIAGKTSIKPDKWVDPQSPIRLQVSAYDEQAQCFCFKDITRQELMGVLKLLYYDITPFYPSDRLPSLTWAWKYLVKAHQREPRFDPKNPLCAYVLQVQLPY